MTSALMPQPSGPLSPQSPTSAQIKKSKTTTLVVILMVMATMLTLVISSPYLYALFCSVTGKGGTPGGDLTEYQRPTALVSGFAVNDQPYQMTVEARVSGDAPSPLPPQPARG